MYTELFRQAYLNLLEIPNVSFVLSFRARGLSETSPHESISGRLNGILKKDLPGESKYLWL